MLSITAYDLLNVIVEGEVTIHTLRLGLMARGFQDEKANEVLLNCLIELCDTDAIICRIEEDYGRSPVSSESCRNASELVVAWERLFGTTGPIEAEPTTKTISVEKTARGGEIALDDGYDVYLPFLRDHFDWPES